MQDRETIHKYLNQLRTYLARLNKEDAEEVIREIESHVYDVLDLKTQFAESFDITEVLAGFGSPRELAAQYVDHLLKGTPPPSGFRAIQKVKRGVTAGLYYAMASFGYSSAALLLLVAMIKLFAPQSIGLWSMADGNSYALAFLSPAQAAETELLGLWLAPLAVAFSVPIFALTRRVLKVLRAAM